MYQLVITFRDPSLGHGARRAIAEILRAHGDDDRIDVSPSGAIIVVRVDREERLAVRRLVDRLGGSVMYDEQEASATLPRAS